MTVAFSRTGRMVFQKCGGTPSKSNKHHFRRTIAEKALLKLLRGDSPESPQSFPPELEAQIDWDYLAELAYREGLAPLVYHALSQSGTESTQTHQTRKFQYVYHLTRRRNAEASEQLAQVLRGLQSAGIESLVLKGAALAGQAYQDPGLRPFADMDILVRQYDLEAAHQVLNELGYQHNYAGKAIPHPSKADVKYRSARQYFHQDDSYQSIDLYWQLGRFPYLASIDLEELWARSCPVVLGGVSALTLAPEDEILHLSLDFALGIWYGHPEIRVLRDIAQIAHQQKVDWATLTETASGSSLSAPLYFSARLSKEFFGAVIPDELLSNLQPKSGKLHNWIVKRLTRNIFGADHPLEFVLLAMLIPLSGTESFTRKAGWVGRFVIPPLPLWGGSLRTLKRVIKPQPQS